MRSSATRTALRTRPMVIRRSLATPRALATRPTVLARSTDNTTGSGNTGIGGGALSSNTGSGNVALGQYAGLNATTGSNNVYIGAGMKAWLARATPAISRTLWGRPSARVEPPCYVDNAGKLGAACLRAAL